MNLSFSGLKTSARRIVERGINEKEKPDLAFEFKSVTECLLKKVSLAIKYCEKKKLKILSLLVV